MHGGMAGGGDAVDSMKPTVELTARVAWLRAQALAGACPFGVCRLGSCRLFDADAEVAGAKYGHECCPLWQEQQKGKVKP